MLLAQGPLVFTSQRPGQSPAQGTAPPAGVDCTENRRLPSKYPELQFLILHFPPLGSEDRVPVSLSQLLGTLPLGENPTQLDAAGTNKWKKKNEKYNIAFTT